MDIGYGFPDGFPHRRHSKRIQYEFFEDDRERGETSQLQSINMLSRLGIRSKNTPKISSRIVHSGEKEVMVKHCKSDMKNNFLVKLASGVGV